MKKAFLLTLAVLSLFCFAEMAQAQTAAVPPIAPTTNTPAAKPPATSAQQSKMKTCAAQYHQQNIPKNQYHTFMSTCLKNPSTATPTTATAVPALPKPGAPATPTASATPTTK